ncbi:flavodoxin family protein [Desulfogranum mediterraneum]|uniref:flavodoxin family protein n=1 Tax=Desulfogranum mediterraneum TaxID=160661 RepID=UPI000426D870|nr:flavodoxin family protein [Desulfogranum mediterraneum]
MLVINGSHRAEQGFTERVVQAFVQGAEAGKAGCEVLYPARQKIAPCASCGKCLFETPGACRYHDDMDAIIAKMEAAELLLLASPVYFDSMSSALQKMIERLRPTFGPYFAFREGRTYHLKSREQQQKAVVISTAGNPERETFVSISRVFNRVVKSMGAQLVGEFYFPASHFMVSHPELLAGQLEAVTMAGKEFAADGSISRELLAQGNKEYVADPERAVQGISRMILEMRERYRLEQEDN